MMSKAAFLADELRPVDDAEAVLFAQEEFVADIQALLHDMMERKCVSRAELAKRLGVSKPRVTQFFAGDGSNLTARTIARVFHALDETAELSCGWARRIADARVIERQRQAIAASGGSVIEIGKWQGQDDWSQPIDGDCHDTTDVSTLVAMSRQRRSARLLQAA